MARIEPLTRPYPPEFAAAMAKVMPPGAEPLVMFSTLAKHPRAWDRFSGGSMAGKGPLDFHSREVVIDRTVARCGNEYEWGIHIAFFAAKAALSEAQIRSTVLGDADDGNWSEPDATLIATVDALIERKKLTDAEHARLRAHFDEAQLLEIVQLVGFYHGVSLICGALDLPLEAGAARFPTA